MQDNIVYINRDGLSRSLAALIRVVRIECEYITENYDAATLRMGRREVLDALDAIHGELKQFETIVKQKGDLKWT